MTCFNSRNRLTKFKWENKVWAGPAQYKNEDLGEGSFRSSSSLSFLEVTDLDEMECTELMMLPTDMALVEDDSFKGWVEKYAEDKVRSHSLSSIPLSLTFAFSLPFPSITCNEISN
jgi:catalase (peroxidase I)